MEVTLNPTRTSELRAELVQRKSTKLGHAQLGGLQTGGAQLGEPHLDVGLIG